MGTGGPWTGDGRRVLRRPVLALGPRPLANADGPGTPGRLSRRRAPVGSGIGEGRWSLLPGPEVLGAPPADGSVLLPGDEAVAEAVAHQLLLRWGVVVWELWRRESYTVPWREVVWALRRLEARGVALGGRFVAGLSGEQYALPEAFEQLQAVRRRGAQGERVEVAGADPLNMTGSVLGGVRVPTRRNQRVVYRDGVVVEHLEAG